MKNEYPPYKPLNKRSRFLKPNNKGQIPCNCVYFNFVGKHCFDATKGYYDDIACDCKVLKGEFCEKFRGGNNEKI